MAVIIGRKQEQKELSRLYHSGEAEMVVYTTFLSPCVHFFHSVLISPVYV